ncbi:OmpA family protein [Sphingomonas lacusdianchii]|jgi:outer membrane protein OmpA-like peptidoglycan-associated protein|uniref:OmpA family protein n=1 Tax=Sphingomonas lacusdianchii TaxID=2917992 RepID=UPI001F5778C1|nr:OmpA family protein [Sphingomonas sp. JXJ CY 53]HEV7291551.1 OmpA family protein [Devosia sp.]
MMFLSTPRPALEPVVQEKVASQQVPALPVYDCFVPGPWIVFFNLGQAELTEEAKSSLAYLLEKERDTCGKFDLNIEGHTHARENRALSRQRAEAVRRYLRGQQIEVSMNVKDMGNRVPRVPNTSTEAEIHNPRVEIHVQ